MSQLQALLDKYSARLSVLSLIGWKVVAIDDGVHDGQCHHSDRDRCTYVYPCAEMDDLDHYALHEVLHAAIRAAKCGGYDAEERLVRDLCNGLVGHWSETVRKADGTA